jgi:hypothetical protein
MGSPGIQLETESNVNVGNTASNPQAIEFIGHQLLIQI